MSVQGVTYSRFPEYRFYLTHHTVTTEVFPLNFNSTKLVKSREKDQVFYRTSFNGKLTFGTNSFVLDVSGIQQNRRDDWELLWLFEQDDPCQILYLTITKTINGITDTYCECYFSTSNGTFDIDACIFEVEPIILDDYTYILEYADVEYNIYDSLTGVTTTVTTRALSALYDETFTKNRWLWDVIENLCDKMLPGVTVSSTFFNDATNPATLSDNMVSLLTIATKNDIITEMTAGEYSTTAMLSFSQLMDILWAMFQVKWKYDFDIDTILVEHISYFEPTVNIDIRSQLTTVATNKYTYLQYKMPKFEKLTMQDAADINFVGTPIYYNSTCVNQNNENNTSELSADVTTDIEYLIANSDNMKNANGWVILCNYLDGATYKVSSEPGFLSSDTKLNMHLSVAGLQNFYWRHKRILLTGYLNNALTTFWSAINTKGQECKIIYCEDFDPEVDVTTELGENYFDGEHGEIESAEILPSGEVSLELSYGVPDNTPTPLPSPPSVAIKTLHIYEGPTWFNDWGNFHAELSETSPIPLIIEMHPIVYDWNNPDHIMYDYDCSHETWTIPDSVLTDDWDITDICHHFMYNHCIDYQFDLTDASLSGWTITIHRDSRTVCE